MIIKYSSNPNVVSVTPGVIAISENVRLVARERECYGTMEMVVYQERKSSHEIANEFLIAGIDWSRSSEEISSHLMLIDGVKNKIGDNWAYCNVFELSTLKEMAAGMNWVAREKEI